MAGIETPEFLLGALDKLGGPDSSPHYAVGWAHAMDTPYQWTKQVASHWGGTRNGTGCTGRADSQRAARCATSSTTSSTSPRRSSRPPGSRRRRR